MTKQDKKDLIKNTKKSLSRCEKLLVGETVEGLKLGDDGLSFDWVTETMVNLNKRLARLA